MTSNKIQTVLALAALVPTENSVLVYLQEFTYNHRLSKNYQKWYYNQEESVKMSICKVLFVLIRGFFVRRSNLILENLALRQQLTVQQRTVKRPKLKSKDRVLWTWLSRIWPEWKSALIIVKPETVIKWNRQGFKLYWRWKS